MTSNKDRMLRSDFVITVYTIKKGYKVALLTFLPGSSSLDVHHNGGGGHVQAQGRQQGQPGLSADGGLHLLSE
jgi:hypothetical protein